MGAAVALAEGDSDLGHRGLAVSKEHLGTVDDDTVVFLTRAGEEAGDIDECDDGDIEGIAEADKTAALAGCIAVEHTGHRLGLVGNDADGDTAEAGKTDQQVGCEFLMHLKELAVVDNGFDNALHIVRLVGVLGDNAVEAVLQTVDRILGRNIGGLLEVVGGDVAHQVADKLDGLLLGLANEMGHTALGGMHHGAAQFIDGHILASDGLHHLGAGKEHVAVLFGHEDEVGECGAVDSTTGAGAEDGADLRDDTAGQDIALENLGIAC